MVFVQNFKGITPYLKNIKIIIGNKMSEKAIENKNIYLILKR